MAMQISLAGLNQALSAAKHRVAAPLIDNLEKLYHAELLDLQDLEQQVSTIAEQIWVEMHNELLSQRVSDYAMQMRSRQVGFDALVARLGLESRGGHQDRAMRALIREIWRIPDACAENVRDAAGVAAMQRIIHHMIACYGTIAAHAKALGYSEDATRFAECADQEQMADAELSKLAKQSLNLRAMGVG